MWNNLEGCPGVHPMSRSVVCAIRISFCVWFAGVWVLGAALPLVLQLAFSLGTVPGDSIRRHWAEEHRQGLKRSASAHGPGGPGRIQTHAKSRKRPCSHGREEVGQGGRISLSGLRGTRGSYEAPEEGVGGGGGGTRSPAHTLLASVGFQLTSIRGQLTVVGVRYSPPAPRDTPSPAGLGTDGRCPSADRRGYQATW